MERHLTILGVLHIALGVLGLLVAAFVFFAIAGAGMLSGELAAIGITSTIGAVIAVFISILSLPALVAGAGLLARHSWARVLTLVISVFNLFNVPFGTVLGLYAFWVLMQRETVSLLR